MERKEIMQCLNAYIHTLEMMLKEASGEKFMALRLELIIAVHTRRKLLGGKYD